MSLTREQCCGTSQSAGYAEGVSAKPASEAHPGARAPCMSETHARWRDLRDEYPENNHLILARKSESDSANGGAVVAEIIFRGHLRKPAVGFLDKADMR